MTRPSLYLVVALLGLLAGTRSRLVNAEPLGDLHFPRQSGKQEVPAAYFPHWVHRIKYKCYVCHDDLFAMERGAKPTMAAMTKGAACGACHNGKQAFGLDVCHRCHLGK